MQPPPNPWNQAPYGAPPPYGPPPGQAPAARDPRSPFARYSTLGTTCIVLAAIQLVFSAQRLVNSMLGGSVLNMQKGMAAPKGSVIPLEKMLAAGQAFASQIAMWEALRSIPFAVASGVLIWLGLRLRKGDASALAAARRWSAAAFVVVAASLAIQIGVTIPATLAYEKAVMELMPAFPTGGAAPFDFKEMTSQMTLAFTIASTVFGTLALSAWPIVLYVWSAKLTRETLAPAPNG